METKLYFVAIIIVILSLIQSHDAGKQKSIVIDDITDFKDFKQLLRTKTNVLVSFTSQSNVENTNIIKSFKEAANIIKGHGTMVSIDCNGVAKKMCRKLKIDSTKPVTLKHYKDGEFHKDYDRRDTTSSIVNFMRDPTGSLPWDEDPTATDVIHLPDADSINRFLKRGPVYIKPSMIMFYAPWCGYCKVLKPEYALAASDLKGEAYLAAIDVARPENSGIRRLYNITGFPTMLYYENGQMKYQYEGDSNRASIIDFIRYPRPHHRSAAKEESEEKDWSLTESEVVHLTTASFDTALAEKSPALVLFYAPWCGHCKKIKPEYERAAATLKDEKNPGILTAVDATKETELGSRFSIKGYPSLKYFENGEYKYDVTARDENKLVEFMRNPQPPPPPDPLWSDEPSNVVHLHLSDFKNVLKKKKHAFVIFYAPWCGHCKQAKPVMTSVAEVLKDDSRTLIGAIDCTQEHALCKEYDVTGYPVFKYFSYYDKLIISYNRGRSEKDILEFLKNPSAENPQKRESIPIEDLFDADTKVLQLTDDNFVRETESNTPTLVMFYAPWCGYCKRLKPIYISIAERLTSENAVVRVAALDCTKHKDSAAKYKIPGYPTLKLFHKGNFVEDYAGRNEEEDIINYLKRYVKKIAKEEL